MTTASNQACRIGATQRNHRNNGRNDKLGNDSMGCGAMRLRPSYGLRPDQDALFDIARDLAIPWPGRTMSMRMDQNRSPHTLPRPSWWTAPVLKEALPLPL